MKQIQNWLKRHREVLAVLAVVALIKFALFAIAIVWNHGGIQNWPELWSHWDSTAYKTIATSGYARSALAMDYWAFLVHFMPLYPLSLAIMAKLTGLSLTSSGIFVSFVAIIGASIMLYKLVLLETKQARTAWLAVLFLNLYPLSYFTVSVYGESLFLLMTIASFYLMRKERYALAGAAAALAILTRFVGVVFIPVYGLMYLRAAQKKGFKTPELFAILYALLGIVAYLLINKYYYGSYTYFLSEQVSFNATKHTIFPFIETMSDFMMIFRTPSIHDTVFMFTRGWNAIFTIIASVFVLLGVRRMRWEYTAFAAGSILMFASLSWGISNARYSLAVFPIFISLATLKNAYVKYGLLFVSAIGLIYFTRIFTSGAWAF